MGAILFAAVLLEVAARLGVRLAPGAAPELRWSQGLAAATTGFALAALLLSPLGWLTPVWIRALTLLGLPLLWRSRAWRDFCAQSRGLRWGLAGALAWFAALATVPNTHWDTQVYHYTLPRLYLEHGGVYWTGTGIYDSLVSLSHPLFAWAMGCGGEPAANWLGSVFLAMLTFSLVSLSRPAPTSLVLALVVSSPLLLAQADGGLTDLAAAAYVSAMLAGGRPGLVWGIVAVATRLNAAPALLLWALATGRAWRWLAALLSGLLPWVLLNLKNTGQPFYPFGSLWQLAPFRGAGSALLVDPTPSPDHRIWASLLSPLLLPGLLLWRRQGWPPLLRFGLLGLLACAALPLGQYRYQLPWLVGLLAWSAWGWSAQRSRPWMRPVFASGAALAGLVAISPWWPKLIYLLDVPARPSYLRQRVSCSNAYTWLKTTRYRKVLLTDPRAYLCPKPFLLIDQGHWPDLTYPALTHYLNEQHCDAVVWNFDLPRVRRAALWQAQQIAGADPQLIDSLGTVRLTASEDPEQHPAAQVLRALYLLCARKSPVYQDGQVLITEWPSSAP